MAPCLLPKKNSVRSKSAWIELGVDYASGPGPFIVRSRSAGYWRIKSAAASAGACSQSLIEPFGNIASMRFSSSGRW